MCFLGMAGARPLLFVSVPIDILCILSFFRKQSSPAIKEATSISLLGKMGKEEILAEI